ncbi:pentatricopeptide repeat (PPR) superfamily protein [Striga asiatica]|uniref:Pentatricopeptide repeat (PPR) superfamily protein n=1 Tax=Striga asiatica TaxID=4170 RepID=A0A5A7PAW5_STRAF|nr:pentatricopeptide repeat (PPR) superfamily protein [Striga asiatica]
MWSQYRTVDEGLADSKYTIFLNHGGKFLNLDGLFDYYEGDLCAIHGLQPDKFSYIHLKGEIQKLGYKDWKKICYKIPGKDVFADIFSDSDMRSMVKLLPPKRIDTNFTQP